MTKRELLSKLQELLDGKGMSKIELMLGGRIGENCKKSTIEDAIKCLEATDEEMNDYLTVFKLKYPNSYNTIVNNGNWLVHSYNRYYVWASARMVLA